MMEPRTPHANSVQVVLQERVTEHELRIHGLEGALERLERKLSVTEAALKQALAAIADYKETNNRKDADEAHDDGVDWRVPVLG